MPPGTASLSSIAPEASPSTVEPTEPVPSPIYWNEDLPGSTFTASWNASSASAYESPDYTESDGSYSDDTDVPENLGGKFWDGKAFRCEDCCSELEGGQCPNGHEIDGCWACDQDFVPTTCPIYCDKCHALSGRPCDDCVVLEVEESEADDDGEEDIDKNRMVYDDADGVWRCTTCMWEIEADGENEGHCQCPPDSDDEHLPNIQISSDLPSIRIARPIELQYYYDYEPADSASSGESVATETDSGDESFIDDEDLGEEEMETALPTLETKALPPSNGALIEAEKPETTSTHMV